MGPAARSRPFHWRKQGPTARQAIVDLLSELRPSARLLVRSTHRRGQVEARAALLETLVLDLIGSIDEPVIESRTAAEDERDRDVRLDTFRTLDLDGSPPFVYRWADKAERLIWAADAIAGIAREHLIEASDPDQDATSTNRSTLEQPYLSQLRDAGVIGELEFPTRTESWPDMRVSRLPS